MSREGVGDVEPILCGMMCWAVLKRAGPEGELYFRERITKHADCLFSIFRPHFPHAAFVGHRKTITRQGQQGVLFDRLELLSHLLLLRPVTLCATPDSSTPPRS